MNQLPTAAAAVIALAYLAGGIVLVVSAAGAVADLLRGRRKRAAAAPVDDHARRRAAAVMAQVAGRVAVVPPEVEVVPVLGVPIAGDHHGVGTGGLAVTRLRLWGPITVIYAEAALTSLSEAALESLTAHELAHVIHHRTRRARIARGAWLLCYLTMVLLGASVVAAAGFVAPRLAAAPAMLATAGSALGFLGVGAAFRRREELEADMFAIDLTRDLEAAAELMDLYSHLTRPQPRSLTLRMGMRLERLLFATHPEPPARLAAMRARLARDLELTAQDATEVE